MSKVTTVGIDLAKREFALHRVDRTGRVAVHRMCKREELVPQIYGRIAVYLQYRAFGGVKELTCKVGKNICF